MTAGDYYLIEGLSPFATVERAEKYIAWLKTLPQDNEQVQHAMQNAQKILAAAQAEQK